MYARVVTMQVQPDKMQEFTDICQNSIIPEVRQVQGFKHFHLLSDPDSNKAMFISMWDSDESRSASEMNGFFQQQMSKLSGVLAAPPSRDMYQVAT